MDANHFDSLVKAVGSAKSGASRRRVLQSFVAGTLAGLTALGGIGAPSARNKCKGAGKSCQSNAQCCSKICDETFTCVCAPEHQQCDRGCFSRFDANHCGACGIQCAESAGEVCLIPSFDPPGSPPRCCKLFGAPCTRDDPRNPSNPECCGGQCTIFGTCI